MAKGTITKGLEADGGTGSAVSRAMEKRKELQDLIKASMKELEKIDEFLRMYRSLSAPDDFPIKGEEEGNTRYILGRAGHGQTQPMFEQMVRAILLDAGKPMQSHEIVEEFRKRGQPLGGNETRTSWNRLWQAKTRGVLVNIPSYGYWLADEPPPDLENLERPKARPRVQGESLRASWKGKPMGRAKILSPAQVKQAEKWLLAGKTFKEVAMELGGLTPGALGNHYFPGGKRALFAKHGKKWPPPKAKK